MLGAVDNSRAWIMFVALWALVGGAGQLAYTITKGHIFNPWWRDHFESNSCVFWLATVGSVGGILIGGALLFLVLR